MTKQSVITSLLIASISIGLSPLQADMITSVNQADKIILQLKAAHFLTQATMGPTQNEISRLANQMVRDGETEALENWIQAQFRQPFYPAKDHCEMMLENDGFPYDARKSNTDGIVLPSWNYEYYARWDQAIRFPDQLRQRMTWALIQIFVARGGSGSGGNGKFRWNMTYYDMLKENAFANYRTLLEAVTYHPIMGNYLSSARNDKGDPALDIYPDENYAREIMQLFSIGIYNLSNTGRVRTDNQGNPIETFDNNDITQLARVFTGLNYVNRNPRKFNFWTIPANFQSSRMVMYEDHHHTESKTFLGHTIPAGQSGDQDISDALDILFQHQNTAPFIAHRLIQRFTSSSPSTGYIGRVANAFRNNGEGVRGDLAHVIQTILMDPEARKSITYSKVTQADGSIQIITEKVDNLHGRLREPVLLMSHFLRFFELESLENNHPELPFNQRNHFKPSNLRDLTQQDMTRAPTVFNYYNADYLPISGPAADINRTGAILALPEFELYPSSCITLNEGLHQFVRTGEVLQRATVDSVPATLVKMEGYYQSYLAKNSFDFLVEAFNKNLCHGTMPLDLQNKLINSLNQLDDNNPRDRFAKAIAVLLSTASYAIGH